MFDTIVLAGGSSRRYQRNKLVELIDDKPLIYHTIKPFYDISRRIVIVTGAYELPDLDQYDPKHKIVVVHNPNHLDGMFTSIKCGIRETDSDAFIIPGDMPLVNTETLQIMTKESFPIQVPTYEGKRGHPILISKSLRQELLAEPDTSNLKVFRDRHVVRYLPVDDPGILIDIDHPDDFLKYVTERTSLHED